MNVRKYKSTDCIEMANLFYESVHTINAKDYTKSQLDAWTTRKIDIAAWNKSFLGHNTLVAEENNNIVGFGDMDSNGYLDRLFVHKDYQDKGIATAIIVELERHAEIHGIAIFSTHASISAKPFFEKLGYYVVSKNKVVRNDVELINYIMEKNIASTNKTA
ncbi:MAG: GNAT family N-acetyltransferase [Longicatena sp.]